MTLLRTYSVTWHMQHIPSKNCRCAGKKRSDKPFGIEVSPKKYYRRSLLASVTPCRGNKPEAGYMRQYCNGTRTYDDTSMVDLVNLQRRRCIRQEVSTLCNTVDKRYNVIPALVEGNDVARADHYWQQLYQQ